MPTYEYSCKDCGTHIEVVQRFTDDPLTECHACGGRLRKVFGSIGISFKGSGFYRTDSRAGGRAGGGSTGDKSTEKTGDKTTEKSGEKAAGTTSGTDKGSSGSGSASGSSTTAKSA